MKSLPLGSKKPLSKLVAKKPLRPNTSEEEVKSKKLYNELKDAYLLKHPLCERCNSNRANQIHHKARQKDNNRFRFFMAICPECHTWIHDHSNLAKELGYIFEFDGRIELGEENNNEQ